MSLFGVGTDVARVSRFHRLLARFGHKFLQRAYHPNEIAQFSRLGPSARPQFAASRWACKEAVLKAFGPRLLFPEIELVSPQPPGQLRPRLRVHGAAHEAMARAGVGAKHVSIAHDGDYATAFVVLENDGAQKAADCKRDEKP